MDNKRDFIEIKSWEISPGDTVIVGSRQIKVESVYICFDIDEVILEYGSFIEYGVEKNIKSVSSAESKFLVLMKQYDFY